MVVSRMDKMAKTSSDVKSYEELSIASVKARQERAYRLWLLIRHVDQRGQGDVTLDELRAFVLEHGLFSTETLRRDLNSGNGIWWEVLGRRGSRTVSLENKGLGRTAARLGVTLRKHPVYLPLDVFRSMYQFRPALVASLFAGKRRVMSLSTLSELTGRTRQALSRYLRKTTKVQRRFERLPDETDKNGKPLPFPCPVLGEPVKRELALTGHYRTCIDGEWHLVKRLANSYQNDYERGRRGMVGRLSDPLNYALAEGDRPERLYHDLRVDRVSYRKVGDRLVVTIVDDGEEAQALAGDLRASGAFVTIISESQAKRQAAARAEEAASRSVKRNGDGAVAWHETGRVDFWGASEHCRVVNRGGVPEMSRELAVSSC